MANIAEVINEVSTVSALDLWYEAKNIQRRRLGLSQVGHKCRRFLWYTHNGYDQAPIAGRTLRLFELGNIIENHLAEDLARIGVSIRDSQKQVVFTLGDITLTGSIDGIASGLIESGIDHLWECKTINDKGYAKLLKTGYESHSETYKAQIHAYMLGLKLTRTFVTVYNKNTSQIYHERINLNRDWILDKLADVFHAIALPEPPERACPRADWFEAKWCSFYKECWKI